MNSAPILSSGTSFHLELKPKNSQRFYSFRMLETTWLNGVPVKNEITKTIHTTWQYLAHDSFLLHIEAFERVHKNKTLSLSEKDFFGYAACIVDDVRLKINAHTGIIDILAFEQLTQKALDTITHLSRSFIGMPAKQALKLLAGIYSNKQLTGNSLITYPAYGMVLPSVYGIYNLSQDGRQAMVNHYNFLPHSAIEVTEHYKMQAPQPDDELIFIETRGHAALDDYKQGFLRHLKQLQIHFDNTTHPVLDEYSGQAGFYRQSGQVAHAVLNIELSCGPDYKKRIEYQLKASIHEEI